jgi:hypothetical protein
MRLSRFATVWNLAGKLLGNRCPETMTQARRLRVSISIPDHLNRIRNGGRLHQHWARRLDCLTGMGVDFATFLWFSVPTQGIICEAVERAVLGLYARIEAVLASSKSCFAPKFLAEYKPHKAAAPDGNGFSAACLCACPRPFS